MRTTPRKKQIWPELWQTDHGTLILVYPGSAYEFYSPLFQYWENGEPGGRKNLLKNIGRDYFFVCELRGEDE